MSIQKLIDDLQDSLSGNKTDLPAHIRCLNVKQRYDLFYLLNILIGHQNDG